MKNWKTILWIGLVLIVVISIWAISHFFNQAKDNKDKKSFEAASKAGFKTVPTKQFKDTSGHSHFQTTAGQNTFKQSTILQNPNISLGGADTIALALDIQRKQIEFYQQIALTSTARALKAESQRDSANKIVRYYKGKFIEIAYHEPVAGDSTDNGTFDYKKFEKLNVIQFWKRAHLLGPRTSYIDISSADTNTVITDYRTFNIQPDPNPFTLRAQAKAAFDFASGRFIPSAGIIGTYKNWEFSYKYYYSHAFQKLEPMASAAYNVWLR